MLIVVWITIGFIAGFLGGVLAALNRQAVRVKVRS